MKALNTSIGLVLSFLLAGCGDSDAPAATAGAGGNTGAGGGGVGGGDDCQIPGSDYTVPKKEQEHACTHVEEGPYGDLVDGDEIANLHMLYTIKLSGAASPGSYEGTFTLTARETTPHVIFVDQDVERAYLDANGESKCLANQVEVEFCDGLAMADVVDLEDKETLTVRIGPTGLSTFHLVAERK